MKGKKIDLRVIDQMVTFKNVPQQRPTSTQIRIRHFLSLNSAYFDCLLVVKFKTHSTTSLPYGGPYLRRRRAIDKYIRV